MVSCSSIRAELLEAELRYKQNRNEKAKAEYRRVLKLSRKSWCRTPSPRDSLLGVLV